MHIPTRAKRGREGSIILRTLDSILWTGLHAKVLKGKMFAMIISVFWEFISRSTSVK